MRGNHSLFQSAFNGEYEDTSGSNRFCRTKMSL